MQEILTNLFASSTVPVLSAFLLGLLTAIAPCPLATNITAIGYISRNIEDRNRVFRNGVVYTAGNALSYTGLAFILYFGADQLKLSGFFQQYGEKIVGPLLILIGLVMLGVLKFSFLSTGLLAGRLQGKKISGYLDVFLLGILLAMAFCPYTGVLYFGMLIPLVISSTTGLILPVMYALGIGIPVIIFAWLIAYTLSGVGKLFNRVKSFETWFRGAVALLFIGVGVYFSLRIFGIG